MAGPHHYIAFHKPYRVLSSFEDPKGRGTVGDYVSIGGLHAAGRLDYGSEGLMLLTNDGSLSHRLTDPRYEHPKVYLVQVERVPNAEALRTLCEGVTIKGRKTRPARAELLAADDEPPVHPRSVPVEQGPNVPTAWLRLVLREGRKRQIRHMTAAVGHPTLRLVRIQIGPICLGDLTPGAWRDLDPSELRALARAVDLSGLR